MTTLPTIIENDLELDILEHIHTSPGGVRQRDLATIVGKSLGMTNAILHRLTEKGLLMVSKVNNRNISYVVTPHGMRELAGRSYRYFKRTIKNVVDYKDAIEAEICKHLQAMAVTLPADQPRQLVLIGKSDLDFILEHLAQKYRMIWTIQSEAQDFSGIPVGSGVVVAWSEEYDQIPPIFAALPIINLRMLVI